MTVTLQRPQKPWNGKYHWTVDTFYRAIAAGVFDEPNRLELIRGELWEKEIVNPPHAAVTGRIARLCRRLFEPEFTVCEEKPIHIDSDGEPIPDITVVTGTPETYETRHPAPEEVRLIVEVADSSVTRDTQDKALLYAQAGIHDYWVSLVNERQLLVHRNPTSNGYAGDPLRLRAEDTVSPLFAPNVIIAVADLLPRGDAAGTPAAQEEASSG